MFVKFALQITVREIFSITLRYLRDAPMSRIVTFPAGKIASRIL
jgi:hypothetical protein